MLTKTILLTGASGFLGRAIQKELSVNYEITSIGRSPGNIIQLDLSKDVPVFKESFAFVIHAAGKAHIVPKTQDEVDKFFQTNYRGSLNLLKGLADSCTMPAQFVFISTVAVYGQEQGIEIDEGHALLGETPYAKSKIKAEDIITAWCREHHVRLTILRLPLVVGESPPGNLGSMISMMKKGLYFGIGSGTARKSMVLAEDVARFIPAVALIGGVYNLTDGYHPAMLELELAIASRLNKSAPRRLPDFILRMAAKLGDLLPDGFPINSSKFEKLTSTLIFSDVKARTQAGWNPHRVIDYLPKAL